MTEQAILAERVANLRTDNQRLWEQKYDKDAGNHLGTAIAELERTRATKEEVANLAIAMAKLDSTVSRLTFAIITAALMITASAIVYALTSSAAVAGGH